MINAYVGQCLLAACAKVAPIRTIIDGSSRPSGTSVCKGLTSSFALCSDLQTEAIGEFS